MPPEGQAAPKGAEGPHPEDAGGLPRPKDAGLFARGVRERRNSAPFSLRGKEKAAGGKKKTPKGDFDFPLWNPLKTTKKGLLPLLGFSQEFGLCRCKL